MMTKEQIFEEFKIVKSKDEKKKKPSYAHRIAYLLNSLIMHFLVGQLRSS